MTWCCWWNICCSSQTLWEQTVLCPRDGRVLLTEPKGCGGWQGHLETTESSPCLGPCPEEFWISPKMLMPTFIGDLCQCLNTYGREISSYFWIEFPVFQILYPLPLVLSPLRKVWLSSLLPHCVFLHSGECVCNDVMSKAFTGSRTCSCRVGQNQARVTVVSLSSGRSTAPVAPHTGNSLLLVRSFGLACKSADEC